MPLKTVQSVADLSPDDIASEESYLVSFLSAKYPNYDFGPTSVLRQILLRPMAILGLISKTNSNNLYNSLSVADLEANSVNDSALIDKLLSNYLITRQSGVVAGGTVRVYLKSKSYTPIPVGTSFVTNSLTFKPTKAFSGVLSSDQVVTGNESVIQTAADGAYYFDIQLAAVVAGVSGNIPKDSVFSSDLANTNVSQIIAIQDFSGGLDTESDAQLIERFNQGISTKNFGSRDGIRAFVKSNFVDVTDVSIIGAGDIEMKRDKYNTLGISSHGKADLYVRSASKAATTLVTKAATLTSANTWIVTFTRDEYAGQYGVFGVYPVGYTVNTPSYTINTVTVGIDTTKTTTSDFVPDMPDNTGVYSRYQTATVTFTADSTGNSVGDTRSFVFQLKGLPDIAALNDLCQSRAKRAPCADYLVKAAIPCFVALSVNIIKGIGEVDPDTDAIKASVVSAINANDFQTGYLSLDTIVNAIKPYLGKRSRIQMPIDLRGNILLPALNKSPSNLHASIWIFNNYGLTVPTDKQNMLSPRTVAFYCDELSVSINVLPSDQSLV